MTTVSGSSGSSIDVNSIVTQLLQIERRPLQVLAQREAQVTSRITAVAQIQGSLASLQAAANRLNNTSLYTNLRADVAGDNLTAAVTDASKAVAGKYSVSVESLAVSQALASSVYGNGSALVGSGTLSFQRGTTSGTSFTAGVDAAVTVTTTETDTLASLRDKINAAFANDANGLTAAIVNDGSGVRLTLLGKGTGAANTFKITATDGDGNSTDTTGLSNFAYDPAGSAGNGKNLTQSRAGTDARIQVNGLELSSTTNKISGVIEGVTLDLTKAEAGKVNTINISRDNGSVKAQINEFVKAYNDVQKALKETTRFDPQTKRGSALTGDATARSVQSQMRDLVFGAFKGNVTDFARLSDIGVETQADGTLKMNGTRVDKALEDPEKVAKFFTQSSDDPDQRGIALRFKGAVDLLIGADGLLPTRTKALQANITTIDQQEERLNKRLQTIEARLRKQYSALDAQLSGLQAQSNSLSNALKQLPGSGG